MKPAWDELGDAFAGSSTVLIGDVDCTVEESLCKKYGVEGYPTIKSFVGGGDGEDYDVQIVPLATCRPLMPRNYYTYFSTAVHRAGEISMTLKRLLTRTSAPPAATTTSIFATTSRKQSLRSAVCPLPRLSVRTPGTLDSIYRYPQVQRDVS